MDELIRPLHSLHLGIRCTNPECGLVGAFSTCSPMHPGHDYFRPFSCKGFYLCPSCSRKRTLLFAENLTEEVLLDLPHRQFVFTMPKAIRPFSRHDRRLFADLSRLIYDLIREFYNEAAGRTLLSGMVIAHQRFGEKHRYEPFKGRVLFHTTYSEYFRENLHIFEALDFIAELTPDAGPGSNPKGYDQARMQGRAGSEASDQARMQGRAGSEASDQAGEDWQTTNRFESRSTQIQGRTGTK